MSKVEQLLSIFPRVSFRSSLSVRLIDGIPPSNLAYEGTQERFPCGTQVVESLAKAGRIYSAAPLAPPVLRVEVEGRFQSGSLTIGETRKSYDVPVCSLMKRAAFVGSVRLLRGCGGLGAGSIYLRLSATTSSIYIYIC